MRIAVKDYVKPNHPFIVAPALTVEDIILYCLLAVCRSVAEDDDEREEVVDSGLFTKSLLFITTGGDDIQANIFAADQSAIVVCPVISRSQLNESLDRLPSRPGTSDDTYLVEAVPAIHFLFKKYPYFRKYLPFFNRTDVLLKEICKDLLQMKIRITDDQRILLITE